MRAGIELQRFAGDDEAVPVVFATDHGLAAIGGPFRGLSAPRLENPHPERPLDCFDLDIAPSAQSMALFAITIEPPGAKSL